ncbi:MAG: 3-oxoacyl-[acyl-carrier-protein] reductase [Thermodesulfovibrionales bacterium]
MNSKVAVVTGASRGLGREIVIALSSNGYNVAVNYCHSEKETEGIVRSIGEASMAVKADVGDLKQVREMADSVFKKWGRVDALINNAGLTKDGLLMRYSENDLDEVLRVNLKGCFNTVKSLTPLMIKSGSGHIINISSYSGLRGRIGQAAYSASKAAIVGLTYTLAKELGEYNIMVNAVLPGYMPTGMGKGAEKAMEKARDESITGCLSDPREVTGFITYLLSTKNITGQVFCLDSRI